MFQLRHMGGALARRSPGAGARATLPGEVNLFTLGVAEDDEAAQAVGARIARLVAAAQPHRAGRLPELRRGARRCERVLRRRHVGRLREVKALYDPQDLFMGNHYIPPAEQSARRAA